MTKKPVLHVKAGRDPIDRAAAAVKLGNKLTGAEATDDQILDTLGTFQLDRTPENLAAIRGKIAN